MVTRCLVAKTDVTMHISRTTVPGNGVIVHHMLTRRGDRLCLMVDDGGERHLFTYDARDRDTPAWQIVLESDEADRLAEVLHSRLIGERGR